jgi:co-chaperonin GroES (HSP10)
MELQSINKFIIKPVDGKQYINTKKIGDSEIVLTTSIENHEDVQRYAEVVALPMNYNGNIKVKDIVIVQHNIFRIAVNDWGVPMQSNNHILDDHFYIDEELIYLIIRDNIKIATDNYVFVEPIKEKTDWEGIKFVQHVGILRFPSDIVKKQLLCDGDKVVFRKNSEYEFKIDDKNMYMMRNIRLLAKIN